MNTPASTRTKTTTLLFFALALFSALIAGCESVGQQYQLKARSGAAAMGSDGTQTLVKKHKVSVKSLNYVFSSRVVELPTFDVAFENCGEAVVSFSPDCVKVYSGGQLVKPYTAEELVKKINEASEYEAQEYTARQNESFMSGTTSGSGNANAAGGMDNSGVMAKIDANKRTNQAGMKRFNREDELSQMAALIIPVNLPPETGSHGLVKLHAEYIDKTLPLRLVVSIDGEDYEFVFDISKA